MFKSESVAKLAAALVKAQKNMGAALKDAKNPFFKSKYADLNAVIDAVVPTYNEEGIAVLQTPQIVDGKPVIQTVLLHESGEFWCSNTEVTASKQNDPQSAGSAISYARRYGLQATTTCKAEDDDGEAALGRKPEATKETTTSTVKTEVSAPKKSFAKKEAEPEAKKVDAEVVVANDVAVPETKPVKTTPAATGAKRGWGAKKTEAKAGDVY